jgi:N-acetylglucosamine-6-phosphate deacetylase
MRGQVYRFVNTYHNSMTTLRARHYQTGEVHDYTLTDGCITAIQSIGEGSGDLRLGQVAGHGIPLNAPAYFDLQINGGLGINFTSEQLTIENITTVVRQLAASGVAAFYPTVITSSADTINAACRSLATARHSSTELAAAIPGIHLEGPFISGDDGPRGAHPREFVQAVDTGKFARWQEAAEGMIRLVTLAPELPGAMAFIEQLVKQSIVVSIGHSAASPAIIRDAVKAGARLSTHLGNGCARQLPRHENLLWEQLACDALWASIIPDGHHLPWGFVQCIERCKTLDRLIITCDCSPLAGLPAGKYPAWDSTMEVLPEGKIILREQGVLAGSWDFTARCVEKFVAVRGLPFACVHRLASDQPRKLLGLSVPKLIVGQPADVIQVDEQGRLLQSFIRGEWMDSSNVLPPAAGAR